MSTSRIVTLMPLLFLITISAAAKDDPAPRVLPQLLDVKDLPGPSQPTGKAPTDTLYLSHQKLQSNSTYNSQQLSLALLLNCCLKAYGNLLS